MFISIASDIADSITTAIGNFFGELFNKLVIGLCSAIYSVVYYLYQIFLALANVSVFDGSIFETITSKIYLILGVITIFALAYNFINLIIDPEKEKGSKQVLDIIKKIITSFIFIVLCPVIFKFSVVIQTAILKQNTIGELFSTSETIDTGMKYQVADLSAQFFRAFLEPADGHDADSMLNLSTFGKREVNDKLYDCSTPLKCTLSEVDEYVKQTGDFYMYKAFALNIHKDVITFNWFIGAIVGCYICYVLISFCIDVAIRQIKLIFYQILAPICIACRIVPNEEKVFKNWLSAVFKTYMAVFTRLILLTVSVLLINIILRNFDTITKNDICEEILCSKGVIWFSKLFLILACITFMKQGSKMICELFGFDDVKIKLNGKLKDGGAYMAGSALSTGITNASRKSSQEFSQVKKGAGWKSNLGHIAKGIAGAGTGFASGAVTGGKNASGADSFKSMNKATVTSMDEITRKNNQKIKDKSEGNTPLKKVSKWFTGATDNASANSTIVQMVKGIPDTAKTKIEDDARKNKKYTYGIDRAFGSFEDDTLVGTDGRKISLGYSLAQEKEMKSALQTAKDNGSDTVTFNSNGIEARINIDDFDNLVKKYSNNLKLSDSYYNKNGQQLDYSTQIVHQMDQLIELARRNGDKEINFTTASGSTTMDTAQFEDLRNNYVKAFSEAIASAATKIPEEYAKFIEAKPKDIDDGSETLADLYRQGLELRTTLTNNQTAEIVKELRTLHTDFQEDAAFREQLQKQQFKFFGDGFLADIKKANNNIQNEVAEKMYRANSTTEKKKDN